MTRASVRRAGTAVRGALGAVRRRAGAIAGLGALAVAYWTAVRPRLLTWGATASEVRRSLPGDDRLPDADVDSTMAITVNAPPEAVWPWLLQLGQDRGGFYSYEWAENLFGLDIHNADHVITAHQRLAVGDEVRLASADRYPESVLEVAELDPERALVLVSPGDPTWWVWSFVLDPVDGGTTRLLVRSRNRLPANPVVRLGATLAMEPVVFAMTREMLRGIRDRAERLSARPVAAPDFTER
ncbi:MAG: hypothetical protein ABEJ22_03515 [Haloferacaceae archaeon]